MLSVKAFIYHYLWCVYMKRFVLYSILFLFGLESILPNSAGFSESMRLGELYTHYELHQKTCKSPLSLVDFMWMHYAAESKHRNEHSHSKLPSVHNTSSFFSIIQNKEVLCVPKFAEIIGNATKVIVLYEATYLFAFSVDLFTPPRL